MQNENKYHAECKANANAHTARYFRRSTRGDSVVIQLVTVYSRYKHMVGTGGGMLISRENYIDDERDERDKE